MKQPEALNCPNCGAGVMSDRSRCEFCSTRLKTVGCSKCSGMMFLGSRFCGHCGERAYPAQLLDDPQPMSCPRCKRGLQLLQIDTLTVRECELCGGFWSAGEVFEQICAEQEKQASVMGFARSYSHPNLGQPAITYVPCPECSQLMNRSNFARSSGIIIDRCRDHGIWFDAGELEKIVEFIAEGGLEKAREKEKIAIADERQKLRDEERRLAQIARRSPNATVHGNETSTIVGRIIDRLFD